MGLRKKLRRMLVKRGLPVPMFLRPEGERQIESEPIA